MTTQDYAPAQVSLSRAGEDCDVTGHAYVPGGKTHFLLGETYTECWADATKWLLDEYGIVLDPDYEIEYERGDSSYVYHEQE